MIYIYIYTYIYICTYSRGSAGTVLLPALRRLEHLRQEGQAGAGGECMYVYIYV